MTRKEIELMEGWEFALETHGEKRFAPVDLPHDWAITAPIRKNMEQGEAQGFRDRWGIGWYRKKIMLDAKKDDTCYYLEFGGIYEDSTVWINGHRAGGRKYGYSPFRLEVTDFVHTGENEILVKVDNTKKPADRWYSGAGIYRTVKWLELGKRHLDEQKIVIRSRVEGKDGILSVYVGTEGCIRLTLKNGSYSCQVQSSTGEFHIRVSDARFWSAEEPNLYDLTIELMDEERCVDCITMKTGIREFSFVPGEGLYVNGIHTLLKGVCLHQDIGCRGIAAVKELWRERLKDLKELGCNCIRASHHIFAEEFLDLCEEMGFYVYEECFDKWTGGLYGRYFETEWKKDLECMVKRDRNRACIFIWGVGNEVENQAQDSMIRILKMLKACVLSLDDTRPVTCAMNPHFKRESNVNVSRVEDIQKFVDEADDTEIYDMEERVERISKIAEIVDVIACNYQEQWYERIHKQFPEKLILGTEIYQFFKGNENQMQNFTCENPSLVPFEKKYVIGGIIWAGFDYLGESMGYPAKGWGGALIRTNGERRASYYIIQSYWSKKPMVYFSALDYSLEDEGVKEHWDIPPFAEHWHFPQFQKTVIPYMIASNCEEVRLFLNEKQFYLPSPQECPNRMILGYLPYIPGKVRVEGYNQGHKVCSREVVTPEMPVQLIFSDGEYLEIPEKEQHMFRVRACDRSGNPYFRESSRVTFQIEGEGRILAVDNGDLMGSESYEDTRIHLYHGQAAVLIKSGKAGETFRLTAYASGMQSGVLTCKII